MDTSPARLLPAHRIVCTNPLPWELAYRPDLDSPAPWTILHPLTADPSYQDVTGPAYLRVRYVLDDLTYRHFIILPYAGPFRLRPVDRIIEDLPPPRSGLAGEPPRPTCPLPTHLQGANHPMSTHPAQPAPPTPGTILVSLAVNDRGEFWKKTEFAMNAGATEAEVDAALDQADTMHNRLAGRMYAPPPPDGGDPAPTPNANTPAASVTCPPAARAVDPANLATDKQVKAIYAIGRNARKMQPAEVDAYCGEQYQGRKPSELTKREASALIDDLKAEPAA